MQTQTVSDKVPASDFFTNTNIMANTVPPSEAETAYAYGDYREFLAVSASIVDAAVRDGPPCNFSDPLEAGKAGARSVCRCACRHVLNQDVRHGDAA